MAEFAHACLTQAAEHSETKFHGQAIKWVNEFLYEKLTHARTDLRLNEHEVGIVVQNLIFFINERCLEEKDFDGGLAQALFSLLRQPGVIAQNVYNNVPYPVENSAEAREIEAVFKKIIQFVVNEEIISKT